MEKTKSKAKTTRILRNNYTWYECHYSYFPNGKASQLHVKQTSPILYCLLHYSPIHVPGKQKVTLQVLFFAAAFTLPQNRSWYSQTFGMLEPAFFHGSKSFLCPFYPPSPLLFLSVSCHTHIPNQLIYRQQGRFVLGFASLSVHLWNSFLVIDLVWMVI